MIAGVVLVLDSGVGHDAEAPPLAVHARGEGLCEGVGVACELPPPDEPQAASKMTVTTIATTLTGISIVASRAWSHGQKASISCDQRPSRANSVRDLSADQRVPISFQARHQHIKVREGGRIRVTTREITPA